MKLRLYRALEFGALFIVVPALLAIHPNRMVSLGCLWTLSIFVLIILRQNPDFNWRSLWHGRGWRTQDKKNALLRFLLATLAIIFLTHLIAPDRFLSFPLERTRLWLIVMVLYPILSALPQELVFRSFFSRRYETLFPQRAVMIAVQAFCFGFLHIMFHNWVSPLLSAVAGGLFAYSYSQHRSLKWAAAEHAAYGCMVFTCGIGFYFLVGGFRPS